MLAGDSVPLGRMVLDGQFMLNGCCLHLLDVEIVSIGSVSVSGVVRGSS